MPELSAGEVEATFAAIDKNSSKVVEFPEFVAWWTSKK